jgi:hypothetical protein
MQAKALRRRGPIHGQSGVILSFAAASIAFGRFLLPTLVLAERADSASGLLLAAGLFTIAIAAVVRK